MFPIVFICMLLQTSDILCRNTGGKSIVPRYENDDRVEFDPEMETIDADYYRQERYRAQDDSVESRRNMEWLSKYLQPTIPQIEFTTKKITVLWRLPSTLSTTKPPTTTEIVKDTKINDRKNFWQELYFNLTVASNKLSDIEKQVVEIIQYKKHNKKTKNSRPQYLRIQDTADLYRRIMKREVKVGSNEVSSTDIIPLNNATTVVNPTDNVFNYTDVSNSTGNASNSSEKYNVVSQAPCEKLDDIKSGRRSGTLQVTPTEIKKKLLAYLEESFIDIKNKIDSLKTLKLAFSENIHYKIGYIIANIDTLEINMLNLKRDMDGNKQFWEDKHILDLYDTLKVSNRAVSGLIESLKDYIQNLSKQPQKNIV